MKGVRLISFEVGFLQKRQSSSTETKLIIESSMIFDGSAPDE